MVPPSRESKFTTLFQTALSGKDNLTMIVNLDPCPDMFVETQHVLQFSAIASKIVQADPRIIGICRIRLLFNFPFSIYSSFSHMFSTLSNCFHCTGEKQCVEENRQLREENRQLFEENASLKAPIASLGRLLDNTKYVMTTIYHG